MSLWDDNDDRDRDRDDDRDDAPPKRRGYRCGGWAAYDGHCGALDCETCHPGCTEENDDDADSDVDDDDKRTDEEEET